MTDFRGKVIAVTGAASGIGRATATILYSRGATLSLADMQADKLEDLVKSLHTKTGQKVLSTVVDVSHTNDVNSWISRTVSELGPLYGAANIAGIGGTAHPITSTSDEEWERVMSVNAGGVFKCLRAEIPHVCEGGTILNISSIAATQTIPGMVSYCASKAAVSNLTKTAAKEAPQIRINALAPGAVDTPVIKKFYDESGVQITVDHTIMKRFSQPEEIAKVVAFMMSEEAGFMTGSVVVFDGGATA